MNACPNCNCPSCSEAAEIKRIVMACESMSDLPSRVIRYWERLEADEAARHPNRWTRSTYHEGRMIKRVVTDLFPENGRPA